ncbi:MAG: RnfABCDGE type electron transport complex subunit D [Methylococcales bacterium]|jgi:Na+-translocating ferredoxin:NAD+ oxidoreductase subunit D|nr:RnfABCDGE type electron transport complex subunit D [Methylococcales bacterium]MBT7445184.1 RnfABCDGE type electron transport complex subunit D [Methylococcales bacterium]
MHSSPHVQQPLGVSDMMLQVLLALVPGIIVATHFFGWGVLFNIVLAIITAVTAEAILLKLRARPILPFLSDYSAVITGLLLALCLPPLAPWWIPVIGTLFAIIIAKHLYGGLGYNPFNPAMIGFAVLLISFPTIMTHWVLTPDASLSEVWLTISSESMPTQWNIDSLTSATPLDELKTQLKQNNLSHSINRVNELNLIPAWQWLSIAYLAGGLYLMARKIITWHIPIAMLAGLIITAAIIHVIYPETTATPWFHTITGATMIGAFFIATDPITAATTIKGRIYYGLGIGILIYIIRTWGGYPDAIAFAVLLMNMAAPMLDQYTQPRVFGGRQ